MSLVSLQLRIPNCTHHFSIVKLTLGNMNSYLTPKVKVAQSCPTWRPHGLTRQSMEVSRPEYLSG